MQVDHFARAGHGDGSPCGIGQQRDYPFPRGDAACALVIAAVVLADEADTGAASARVDGAFVGDFVRVAVQDADTGAPRTRTDDALVQEHVALTGLEIDADAKVGTDDDAALSGIDHGVVAVVTPIEDDAPSIIVADFNEASIGHGIALVIGSAEHNAIAAIPSLDMASNGIGNDVVGSKCIAEFYARETDVDGPFIGHLVARHVSTGQVDAITIAIAFAVFTDIDAACVLDGVVDEDRVAAQVDAIVGGVDVAFVGNSVAAEAGEALGRHRGVIAVAVQSDAVVGSGGDGSVAIVSMDIKPVGVVHGIADDVAARDDDSLTAFTVGLDASGIGHDVAFGVALSVELDADLGCDIVPDLPGIIYSVATDFRIAIQADGSVVGVDDALVDHAVAADGVGGERDGIAINGVDMAGTSIVHDVVADASGAPNQVGDTGADL